MRRFLHPHWSDAIHFDSNSIENSPRDISHYQKQIELLPSDNMKYYKELTVSDRLLHKDIAVEATLKNGKLRYHHDALFFAILPHLFDPIRKNSFPK